MLCAGSCVSSNPNPSTRISLSLGQINMLVFCLSRQWAVQFTGDPGFTCMSRDDWYGFNQSLAWNVVRLSLVLA